MPLYLIGFMGSGKTTVGKKLAKELGYLFIDLDHYLERKYQQTIVELFETKGEDEFRKLEQQCLAELSNMSQVVISTGGGAPCFFDNMALMNRTGKTIYLQATPALLLDRIKNAKEERPLLKGANTETELKALIKEKLTARVSFYEQATIVVNAASVKVKDILEIVLGTKY